MGAVTIRKLSDEAIRALKLRAAQNGRSAEAEMRWILEESAKRPPGRDLGEALHEFAKQFGGLDLEIERDRTPAGSTVSFE